MKMTVFEDTSSPKFYNHLNANDGQQLAINPNNSFFCSVIAYRAVTSLK